MYGNMVIKIIWTTLPLEIIKNIGYIRKKICLRGIKELTK